MKSFIVTLLILMFFGVAYISVAEPYIWTTIAGSSGTFGRTDGPGSSALFGTDARFADPEGIFRDAAGNLFVGETWSETVREISFVGTTWVPPTIADAGTVSA